MKLNLFSKGKDEISSSGLVGLLLSMLSMILVAALVILFFVNSGLSESILSLIDKMIYIMGIGAALLGVRKIGGIIKANNSSSVADRVEKSIHRDDYDDDGYRDAGRTRKEVNTTVIVGKGDEGDAGAESDAGADDEVHNDYYGDDIDNDDSVADTAGGAENDA